MSGHVEIVGLNPQVTRCIGSPEEGGSRREGGGGEGAEVAWKQQEKKKARKRQRVPQLEIMCVRVCALDLALVRMIHGNLDREPVAVV